MKIITVLLNPTIDEIYEIENFHVGGTFKVNKKITYPVGKAISVALGIRELDKNKEDLTVIALVGQDEISIYLPFLISKNIKFDIITVDGKTRSNKTINDLMKNTTTHIREKGFEIDNKHIDKLFEMLTSEISLGDIVVFSGSIPPGVSQKVYSELIEHCKERGAITVLDSSERALISGLTSKPRIIKPNLMELSQILENPSINKFDVKIIDKIIIDISIQAIELLDDDIQIILVTLGENGALCLTKDEVLYGNAKLDSTVDTVGSGDAFLAGFVINYAHGKDLEECFTCAIACGAANTLIPGPGIFNLEDVIKIKKNVYIKRVNL